MTLSKQATEFIKTLEHDDLVCFLAVYSNATRDKDVEQYEALKKEMLKKLANNQLEKELWEK